ncbi:hypothetical protein HMN09_00330800 [Mycena chlorophos]|uniref:Arrestin-like N-terminal domain-containing protein n=1 Tax=Mycena chlorophos TaxID=658473 RepID=A0A8H6TGF0_MYCCL|nr:hypothetical protein HMN09_00330800 [Mycena chlorophos]
MSLLRDVLKRGKGPASPGTGSGSLGFSPLSSKKNLKSYASSIKSSGGASMRSIAESVLSFYSVVTGGGPRVPKRRRADFSRLGVPEWHANDPPPPSLMPGTVPPSLPLPPYTTAHSTVMHQTEENKATPWLGVVVYSHAPGFATMPMFHNQGKWTTSLSKSRAHVYLAKIMGEVRMIIAEPMALSSIDVWYTMKSESVVDMHSLPVYTMKVSVWTRKMGDPRVPNASSPAPFKGKFPVGTYVFPFEMPELPTDTLVKHPDEERSRNKARVPLPPTFTLSVVGGFSGSIKHTLGVNVTREGLTAIDEEFDVALQYLPLNKLAPPDPEKPLGPFPFLPSREDWPFAREEVGGWTLTPFGGRGRMGEEIVEMEGILGVPATPVTAGSIVPFTLLLHSASPLALAALAQPAALDVGFYRSDIFALDALNPRNSSRKNRHTVKLGGGNVWIADEGRPTEGAPEPELKMVDLPETSSTTPASPTKVKPATPSRMQQVWTAEEEEPSEQNGEEKRPPSPAPSLDDLDDQPESERVVRLDGELRVPACSHPSFRYTSMAREYILFITFKHPQYSHISPNAVSIVTESPIWYVFDRFDSVPDAERTAEVDYSALPIKGDAIPLRSDAIRHKVAVGSFTTQKRPTFKAQRVAAF